ncbi:MAG: hypothetical protein MK135_16050 [Polyangiaceae bacterium]|nr:hypothetical protein [Polyangiaceae bacterium]
MKDLNLHRLINVVAAGGVIVSLPACGKPYKKVAKDYCAALSSCADDFNEDSCIDETTYNLKYYATYYGPPCGQAQAALLDCLTESLDAASCYADVKDCATEAVEAVEACYDYSYFGPDYDYSSYYY